MYCYILTPFLALTPTYAPHARHYDHHSPTRRGRPATLEVVSVTIVGSFPQQQGRFPIKSSNSRYTPGPSFRKDGISRPIHFFVKKKGRSTKKPESLFSFCPNSGCFGRKTPWISSVSVDREFLRPSKLFLLCRLCALHERFFLWGKDYSASSLRTNRNKLNSPRLQR